MTKYAGSAQPFRALVTPL